MYLRLKAQERQERIQDGALGFGAYEKGEAERLLRNIQALAGGGVEPRKATSAELGAIGVRYELRRRQLSDGEGESEKGGER